MSTADRTINLHPKIVEDTLDFINVIAGSTDEVALVLRLHASTEYFLDRFICLHIVQGSTLVNDERFTYYHKLQLANAIGGIEPALIGALRKLSKLRNRCAHERRPSVTPSELTEIGTILGNPFEKAYADFDGENREFRALSWAIFSLLSRQVTPHEIAAESVQLK